MADRALPGIVVSALRGGAGKTILSIGITAALRNLGYSIAPFKKGPDYIDVGWLALAAGRPCYNLDTFLIQPEQILHSYQTHSVPCDFSVVEGNRGLYDAIDTVGETSTAELAKLLGLEVLLCLDCTKTTRTMAAVVSGCDMFDPDVAIRGVILNRVAGTRHESILRNSIETHCGIPVVGAIPKLKEQRFPERHMGLVPTPEHEWAVDSIRAAEDIVRKNIDLSFLVDEIKKTHAKPVVSSDGDESRKITPAVALSTETAASTSVSEYGSPVIGVLRDSAFQFYYPENIEALERAGAKVVYTSPLSDAPLPRVDALYIGGGFPETHARELSKNEPYRHRIKHLAKKGLPIYAECGGLMYLGRDLVLDPDTYPMAGVLPLTFGFSKKPQGHGYTVVSVERENPFFKKGTLFRGHEFHYSSVLSFDGTDDMLVFSMKRGNGILHKLKLDGLCYRNVLATYSHIHALGMTEWADALVNNARRFKENNPDPETDA